MKRLIILLSILAALFINIPADAATLTTEIARVREYLYQTDSSNSTYTDAQITEAINQGQDLLSNLLSYSANHESISSLSATSATTYEVSINLSTISVYLKKIIAVSITYPSGSLTPAIQIKPEEYPTRWYKGTTKDPVFFIGSGYLFFYPANSGGSVSINVTFLKSYPRLSSGSDTIGVQDRFLNLLTLCSVWYILQADNQQARAANIYKLLTDLVTIENNSMVNSNVIERVQGGSK